MGEPAAAPTLPPVGSVWRYDDFRTVRYVLVEWVSQPYERNATWAQVVPCDADGTPLDEMRMAAIMVGPDGELIRYDRVK